MKRRGGFTLVELAIGIAVGCIVGLLIAAMLRAGVQTLRYALRQSQVLTNARKAIIGDGGQAGVLSSARMAAGISALVPDSLTMVPPGGASAVTFALCPDGLCQSQAGAADRKVAGGISSVSFSYYNTDANGLIMSSTAPEAATMVSASFATAGSNPNEKTYSAWTVARLRNSP